jgi:hypothetical protein
MKALLDAMVTAIAGELDYLSWVGVLDDELLPPEEPAPPFVGLKDGGIVLQSLPGKKDLEVLTVYVIAYQSVLGAAPGASILGATEQLGDPGKGLLTIHDELKTFLNDNFLSLSNIHWAHRDRLDASRTLANEDGRLIQLQRATYTYRRYG